MIDKEVDQAIAKTEQCQVPPEGRACPRGAGHDGPCAALPSGLGQPRFVMTGGSLWDNEEQDFWYRGKNIDSFVDETETKQADLRAEIAQLKKLIDAADYLQSCRRSYPGLSNHEARLNRERIQRASDHYDFLRSHVKL